VAVMPCVVVGGVASWCICSRALGLSLICRGGLSRGGVVAWCICCESSLVMLYLNVGGLRRGWCRVQGERRRDRGAWTRTACRPMTRTATWRSFPPTTSTVRAVAMRPVHYHLCIGDALSITIYHYWRSSPPTTSTVLAVAMRPVHHQFYLELRDLCITSLT
jgi:hypothetical protein